MQHSVTTARVLYGFAYGGIVASAYLFVRLRGQDGGLGLFSAAAASVFLIHLALWPRLTLRGVLDRKMVLRGLLYGLTQVLIFKAMANGHTSTALVASTMGSVFGVILGRAVLRERIDGLAVVAGAFCFAAVFLNPMLIAQSHWGVLGGLIQGTGFVLARSLMVEKKSRRQSISTGFFVAALVGVVVLSLEGKTGTIFTTGAENLAIGIGIALVVQYAFFHLYKVLDAQRASMLTLSRIPWAFGLEYAIVGTALAGPKILAATLITMGAALLLIDAKLRTLKTTEAQP
jgi:drug/metabolite transporter (DMT)-like permease